MVFEAAQRGADGAANGRAFATEGIAGGFTDHPRKACGAAAGGAAVLNHPFVFVIGDAAHVVLDVTHILHRALVPYVRTWLLVK